MNDDDSLDDVPMCIVETSDRKTRKVRKAVWEIFTPNAEIAKAGAIQRHEARYKTGNIMAIKVTVLETPQGDA